MEEFEIDSLFPIPLYKTVLDIGDDEIIKIENFVKELKFFEYSDSTNGMGTICQKILDYNIFENLKSKIDTHFQRFVFESLKIKNCSFRNSSSWINCHKKGENSPIHFHCNSVFSGIFYLKVPQGDSGNIRFYSRTDSLSTDTFKFDRSEYNIFNSNSWGYTPQNKLLLIFPSYLHHSVSENNTNELRYSLAFNYFIDGEIGIPTQKLTLKVF